MADVTAAHYFVGTIGLALLREWYVDGEVNDRRLAEVRHILDSLDEFPNSLVLDPVERGLVAGYEEWAPEYDGPNPLVDAEEQVVHALLDDLGGSGVKALDAACGTGRHAQRLVELGCDVVGLDQSTAMLEVARENVPSATFDEGSLEALPYADGSFDLVTVSLALCHLADPAPAVAELGRVLRRGGSLVISDPHPMGGSVVGGQAFYGGIAPDRPMTWVRNHHHLASTWLAAFDAAGLSVERCLEPLFTDDQIAASPASLVVPEAARAMYAGLPALWVWIVTWPGS